MLMATPVGTEAEFEFGPAIELFQLRPDDMNAVQHYDVAHDGKRILVNEPVEVSEAVEITVVVNWSALR